MKKKTLKEQLKEILYSPHITSEGRIGYPAVIVQIIQAIKKRDKYIIGEKDKIVNDSLPETLFVESRNSLRDVQLKRAEETL